MTARAVSKERREVPSPFVTRGNSWLRYLRTALIQFFRDNAMGMAGMIAFFAFLALIPLAILLLAFIANLPTGIISATQIQHLFHDVIPGLTQHQFLHTYWQPIKHSKVATTILGVVSLLAGTLGLHDSVDWAVNRIWTSSRGRPFWVAKLRGIATILWVIAFVVLSLFLTWLWADALDLVRLHALVVLGWPMLAPTFLLDIALCTALYKLTPTVDVELRAALTAGILAAVLWSISKALFSWWVLQVGTYNRVYGPVAATVIVLLWIWITSMVFLYGAELSAALQGATEVTPSEDKRSSSTRRSTG